MMAIITIINNYNRGDIKVKSILGELDFEDNDYESFYTKDKLIKEEKVLTKDKIYNVCDNTDGDIIMPLYESECTIHVTNLNSCKVVFTQNERKKYWFEDLGLKKYIEIKKSTINKISKELPKGLNNLKIEGFIESDEDDYYSLCYSVKVNETTFDRIFELLDELVNNIKKSTNETIMIKHNITINI